MKILISESQYNKLMEGKYIDFPVDSDIALEVWEDDTKLTLDTIVIPKSFRNQGMGTKIMEMVCEYADEVNKPLFLTPSTSYGATSVDRLVKFYKKFGFKRNKERDLSMHYLIRYPNVT
jgi:ribosomal protein S18 acetylase RimI-like enzyme